MWLGTRCAVWTAAAALSCAGVLGTLVLSQMLAERTAAAGHVNGQQGEMEAARGGGGVPHSSNSGI
jgi:hypothetical protein